jgi:23S rRNA pseudouridine955/2504/2580 synthase
MLTHGQGGVDEAARSYFASRSAASIAFTPAPLHRLDRNTSGALAVSASIAGAVAFSAALRGGLVGKAYLALLGGALKTEETWIDALSRDGESGSTRVAPDGKRAIASAAPLMTRGGATLAYIRLGTGRTHQIRAQAASRGLPLLGDLKYGGSRFQGGYILHCLSLSLPPGAGIEGGATIEAPLPEPALAALRTLFGPGFYDEMLEAIAARTPGPASATAR